jgi:hypothetical protein
MTNRVKAALRVFFKKTTLIPEIKRENADQNIKIFHPRWILGTDGNAYPCGPGFTSGCYESIVDHSNNTLHHLAETGFHPVKYPGSYFNFPDGAPDDNNYRIGNPVDVAP